MYAAFVLLEKAYRKVDREALKIHDMGRQLLKENKAFYGEASACERVEGELS